jgi:hypothetical protein
MDATQHFVLAAPFLGGSELLGCLITDLDHPFDDLYRPPESLVEKQKSMSWRECNIEKVWPSPVSSPTLRRPFHSRPVKMHSSAAKYQRYELGDPETWFKELSKEAEARRWMLNALEKGQDVYILTHLLTMQDGIVEVSKPTLLVKKRASVWAHAATHEEDRYDTSGRVLYSLRTVEEAIFAVSCQRIKGGTIKKIPGFTAEGYRKLRKPWSQPRRLVPEIGQRCVMEFSPRGPQEILSMHPQAERDQDTLSEIGTWQCKKQLSIHTLEEPEFPEVQPAADLHCKTSLQQEEQYPSLMIGVCRLYYLA